MYIYYYYIAVENQEKRKKNKMYICTILQILTVIFVRILFFQDNAQAYIANCNISKNEIKKGL